MLSSAARLTRFSVPQSLSPVDHRVVGASDADRRGWRAHRVALATVQPPDRARDRTEAAFEEGEEAALVAVALSGIGKFVEAE